MKFSRRSSFVRFLPLALFAGAAAPAMAQDVKVTPFATVGSRPISLASATGDNSRLYAITKSGRVHVILNGSTLSTAFLDHTAAVEGAGEGGMLGIAMHPNYAVNGKFYLSYNTGPSGDHVISQFTRSAGNPNTADPNSEQIIWGPYPHTTQGHKAGDITFGPDGLLYLSIGDGLAGGTGVGARAQDLMDARGKILRFDVDLPFPHIPPTNPFVGDPNALDEIYAFGLRNPFRMGIDSLTGDVYMGDVGQSAREEINFIPSGVGGRNFGWKCKEGTLCFSAAPPGCDCNNPTFVDPLFEYINGVDGCAAIGGKVYRGSQIPSLYGWYIFTDFCTNRVQAITHDGTTVTGYKDLSSQTAGATNVTSIEEGADRELYLVSHYSGQIWRLDPRCDVTEYCSANPNSTGSPATIGLSGTCGLGANNMVLHANSMPQNQFGYFLMAETQGFLALFGGSQGNLCLGAPIVRFSGFVQNSGASGSVDFPVDVTNLPAQTTFGPGDTWNFQYWHRDQNPLTTSNTTAGLSVVFTP